MCPAGQATFSSYLQWLIEPDDRISYAEALLITGRSHRYLTRQARRGELARMGGGPRETFQTWLSRSECEALALRTHRPGKNSPYWVTVTEAARLLGVARNSVYQARNTGRLTAWPTRTGKLLVRRIDVIALLATGKVRGRQHLKPQPDKSHRPQQPSGPGGVLVHLRPTQGRSRGVEHRAAVQPPANPRPGRISPPLNTPANAHAIWPTGDPARGGVLTFYK